MKKIILLVVLLASISVYSQSSKKWRGNYLLNGTVENADIKQVSLSYLANSKIGIVADTIIAVVGDNNKFSISGFIDEPIFSTLQVGENELKFFIDPAIIDLQIASNNKDFTIKGSSSSNDYLEIEELKKGFAKKNEKELRELNQRLDSALAVKADIMNEYSKRILQLEAEPALAALTFASKERGSFAVLKAMDDLLNPENDYYKRDVCMQIMRIYAQMPEHIKDTPTGVDVSGKILKAKLNMKF